MRIASYNVELHRGGPGLLLRDILRGEDPQIDALRRVIAVLDADILALQGVDFDADLVTLVALRDTLAQGGAHYPHVFARPPNTGVQTGLDMDGDGHRNDARDAQGYGEFFGQGGMAILSRHPILSEEIQDFSTLLWRDMPGARLPQAEGRAFPSDEAQAAQRLSSVAHWMVPVGVPSGRIHLMSFHATPPVFDGPEDRNGLRNHDEIVFWRHYLDGAFGPAPTRRFVLAGQATIDPADGEGLKQGIVNLLSDPRFRDPAPRRPSGPLADSPGQSGDPRLDTVAWSLPEPGHLRASYVLPSADLTVADAGVLWPPPGDPLSDIVAQASRHRPVWVDLKLD